MLNNSPDLNTSRFTHPSELPPLSVARVIASDLPSHLPPAVCMRTYVLHRPHQSSRHALATHGPDTLAERFAPLVEPHRGHVIPADALHVLLDASFYRCIFVGSTNTYSLTNIGRVDLPSSSPTLTGSTVPIPDPKLAASVVALPSQSHSQGRPARRHSHRIKKIKPTLKCYGRFVCHYRCVTNICSSLRMYQYCLPQQTECHGDTRRSQDDYSNPCASEVLL